MHAKMKRTLVKVNDFYLEAQKKNEGHKLIKFLRDDYEGSIPEKFKPIWYDIPEKDRTDVAELFILDCPTRVSVPECMCGSVFGNTFPDGKTICIACGSLK